MLTRRRNAIAVAQRSAPNSKFEYRNSKQIRNSKFKCSKRFEIWNLKNWDLFRISNLGFRISERRAAARRDVVPIEE